MLKNKVRAAHMVVNPRPVTISKVKKEVARIGLTPSAAQSAPQSKVKTPRNMGYNEISKRLDYDSII